MKWTLQRKHNESNKQPPLHHSRLLQLLLYPRTFLRSFTEVRRPQLRTRGKDAHVSPETNNDFEEEDVIQVIFFLIF